MFSGIIESVGLVESRNEVPEGAELVIRSDIFSKEEVGIGDSICVSGVCLTVTEIGQGVASFDVCSETLRCTSLASVAAKSKVNLERSLRVGDRVHGHFVSGHVDTTVALKSVTQEGETWKFSFAADETISPFLAQKGSITINGTSLTLGEISSEDFVVYIIPHTFSNTTFSQLKVGDLVNIEVDMLARYVAERLKEK